MFAAVAAVVVVPLLVFAFVKFAIWIEDRHPSANQKTALFPSAQRVLTRPVVGALRREIERRIEQRLSDSSADVIPLPEALAGLADVRQNRRARQAFALALAKDGSTEALAALRAALASADPAEREWLAQLLGSSRHGAVKPLLLPLINDANEAVARAAVRSLCLLGGDDVVARMMEMLGDDRRGEGVRAESALGLGVIGTEPARDALVGALGQKPPEPVLREIVNGLGCFEFPMVAEVFGQLLGDAGGGSSLRVTAAEALAHSSSDAAPFLLNFAGRDADPAVRASAAWAISAHGGASELAPALVSLAQREMATDVRRRLYEAMLPQPEIPGDAVLRLARAETDPAARIAAFNALGAAAAQQAESPVAAAFDREVVPELVQAAVSMGNANLQMRAVFALRRAGTTAAKAGLVVIAGQAPPQIAAAARNGFQMAAAN
jgi:HEAT repeat protein